MDEPIFSPTLERLYRRLPEFIRDADPDTSYTTKRILSLVGDQLGEIEVLLDRIDYVTGPDGGVPGDTSELVDPAKADATWLRWLAQPVSVRAGDLTTVALRAAIADARSGWQVCSQDAVLAVPVQFLTGTRRVDVTRDVGGDPFHVTVTTYKTETPSATYADLSQRFGTYAQLTAAYPTYGALPNAAVAIGGALALQAPGHVQLDHSIADGASYAQLATQYPTYAEMAAALPTYAAARFHVPGS